jgi:hypothetical protein
VSIIANNLASAFGVSKGFREDGKKAEQKKESPFGD